jgi:hypothetical protein
VHTVSSILKYSVAYLCGALFAIGLMVLIWESGGLTKLTAAVVMIASLLVGNFFYRSRATEVGSQSR